MSDSESGSPGFKSQSDHFLDLFLGNKTPSSKSLAVLVNSQLGLPVANWDPQQYNIMFNLNYLFQLFVRPTSTVLYYKLAGTKRRSQVTVLGCFSIGRSEIHQGTGAS